MGANASDRCVAVHRSTPQRLTLTSCPPCFSLTVTFQSTGTLANVALTSPVERSKYQLPAPTFKENPSRTLIAATALEQYWGEDEPLLFLGEWARLLESQPRWQDRPSRVLPYHWGNRSKLLHDNVNIELLYERVLAALAGRFNSEIGRELGLMAWRIILGPWLQHYLCATFDRWEVIDQMLLSPHSNLALISDIERRHSPPMTTESAISEMINDDWNQLRFSEIIAWRNPEQVQLIDLEFQPDPPASAALDPPDGTRHRRSLRQILIRNVSLKWSNAGIRRSGKILYDAGLPLRQTVRLAIRAGAFPIAPQNPLDRDSAMAILRTLPERSSGQLTDLDINASTPFERYLSGVILRDVPYSSRELVGHVVSSFESARTPESVLSSNAYWGSDAFKAWAGLMVARGADLAVCEHGGGFPIPFNTFGHEETISSKYGVWHKPVSPHQRQIYPQIGARHPRMCGSSPNIGRSSKLLIVGLEKPRYAYRIAAHPMSTDYVRFLEATVALMRGLDQTIRPSITYRPYSQTYGWDPEARIRDQVGFDFPTSRSDPLEVACNKSKLVVCTYAQTTLSQSMLSGVPTLLCFSPALWEIHESASPLIERMISAKLIFYSGTEAASHINAIWGDVGSWWDSPETKSARQDFLAQTSSRERNFLDDWASLLDPT